MLQRDETAVIDGRRRPLDRAHGLIVRTPTPCGAGLSGSASGSAALRTPTARG